MTTSSESLFIVTSVCATAIATAKGSTSGTIDGKVSGEISRKISALWPLVVIRLMRVSAWVIQRMARVALKAPRKSTNARPNM